MPELPLLGQTPGAGRGGRSALSPDSLVPPWELGVCGETRGAAPRQHIVFTGRAGGRSPCRLGPAHGPFGRFVKLFCLPIAGPQFAEDPSQLPPSPFGDYRQYQ